jgi:hypothetical protein
MAHTHGGAPIELQQFSSQNVPKPSEQGQDYSGTGDTEEDLSTCSGVDNSSPHPAKSPAASSSNSMSRSATQAHSTDLSIRPVPTGADGNSTSFPPHAQSDGHISDQITSGQEASEQEVQRFGLTMAWQDRPSATAPVYVGYSGTWQ